MTYPQYQPEPQYAPGTAAMPGPPPYPPTTPQPPKKGLGVGAIIAIVVGALVLLGCGGAGVVALASGGSADSQQSTAPSSPARSSAAPSPSESSAGLLLTKGPDPQSVESIVAAQLTARAQVPVKVTCPDNQPLRKGYIFDCVADDGATRLIVRITEDDDQGHFTSVLTTQRAP